MQAEQSLVPPARALSQALTHVPAARAQLSRSLGDLRGVRRCGFSTHSREILPADAACLRLQFESGHMDLRIAARDGLALLLNEHDDTLRVSIAGTLLSDFLGAFVPLGLGVAEVVAFQRDAEAGDALGFGMTLGDIDAVPLTASPSLLAALQAAITGLASPVQLPAWLASLRVTTRLRIGKRTASAALLQSLRPGDVLLHGITSAPIHNGEVLWGLSGGEVLRAPVRLNLQQMILEDIPTMQHDITEPEALLPSTDVAALELPVQLEVDQLALPLSVLSGLQPGQILELSVPIDQADIRLVVYGQTIGTGRLLAVGEHLGVQILSMSESTHADA
ncbi:TPA: type III secretion system cytoplasmic ring protein SctQ [Xanthomonas vasicola pv. zeae]|uniref:YscQ/HrcQ family type III secretion apparatus protein n=2 Tax=Xanthomonas vasicola TaxID=56459 RepID=A0AAE8F782_XANVA|nr:type III secretion system cytoplasmic ring protein SctQ [Xanthomonas vasicola]AVQ05608.1 YscQ/HrcQ family type III secretion apparatus protein [Xanthomonas vasicola pv. vasculorum]AZM69806.1 YscQ/HrcQ family type III secretion apparatus protein [Xanthomonas vasicola pv. vasculorum]AZR29504.1 YscQ/HrcQ family type III secretion apparatus protein [Xanthomonas vasicola pv. musacearum NCPPB 4379]MBV6741745.1 type III secretion system cytoplasmic ring protein SctQ [Xanthomonas vasicola pv. musace